MLRFLRFLNSLPLFILSGFGLTLLLLLMLRPSSDLPNVLIFPYADKFFHFIAFGLVSIALLLDVHRYYNKQFNWCFWLIYGIGLVALGVLTEYLQSSMGQGRSSDLWDAVADAAGTFILPLLCYPQINKCIELYSFDIRQCCPKSKELNFVKQLYFSSFPENERRSWADFEAKVCDKSCRMKLLLLFVRNKPIGFATMWRLDTELYYVEHFAIDPIYRGQGFGTVTIDYLKRLSNNNLVLEVEPEELCEISRRRVKFYLRCGFYAHRDFSYMQPAYADDLSPVELMLLSTNQNVDLQFVTQQLYTVVYNKVV